jgi:hypothetical protein
MAFFAGLGIDFFSLLLSDSFYVNIVERRKICKDDKK